MVLRWSVGVTRLELPRAGILGHRRRTGLLDRRAEWSGDAVRRAAWAGLTDSMPRAAQLSLHARLANVTDDLWEDAAFVQVWGPRYSVYVVCASDVAVFTRGRLPAGGAARARAEDIASRLAGVLGGEPGDVREAAAALGIHHNAIRYAAPTGTLRIRWDGARQPEVWRVEAPDTDDDEMRRELARRYLHVAGPSTPMSYSQWAGLRSSLAEAVFDDLADELVSVATPVGDGWILAADEPSFRSQPDPPAPARLLPSGDSYWLCWGADRDLLVQDATHREMLWTSRVWPGAVMVDGEIVGTWRRSQHAVTIQPWRDLPAAARDAVEAEAISFPLPRLDRQVRVSWSSKD
jgi:hypothetical protein